MSQQTIGVGSSANDGTGDPLRTAFQKTNSNFTELYTADAANEKSANKDTDTSMSANSDVKYPSQKAVKAYVDNSATPDASASTKGKAKLYTSTGTNTDGSMDQASIKAAIIGLQDLFVPASAMWPRVTNGCADLSKTEMVTSLVNIQTLDFDPDTQTYAQFGISLPRNWNNETVTAKIYWMAASGSGDVKWSVAGGAYSDNDLFTSALGTAQTVTDTLLAASKLQITGATSAITLAGSPADADMLYFEISRVAADGADTLTSTAKLIGIVLTITTDAAVAS